MNEKRVFKSIFSLSGVTDMKRLISLFLILMLAFSLVSCKKSDYNEALELLENGDFDKAYCLFEDLGDYKDAKDYLGKFYFVPVEIVVTESDDETETTKIEIGKNGLTSKVTYIWEEDDEIETEINEYTYDNSGNIISETWSDDSGIYCTLTYSYDDHGSLIRTITSYRDDEDYVTNYQHTYDSLGNIIKTVKSEDGEERVYTYVYDGDGNLVNETITAHDGYFCSRTYTYDESGNLIEERTEESNFSEVTDYLYDDKGNLVKKTRTSSYGFSGSYEFTYDKCGNVTQISYSDSNDYGYTEVYKYDSHGNAVECTYTSTSGSFSTLKCKYIPVYNFFGFTDEEIDEMLGSIIDW